MSDLGGHKLSFIFGVIVRPRCFWKGVHDIIMNDHINKLLTSTIKVAVLMLAASASASTVTRISTIFATAIATDGANLYIGTEGPSLMSVPIAGGEPTTLYSNASPCCILSLTRIGTNLFWIDPNGDPDATAIFRGSTAAGPITKIYSGFATGQPIVDGSGLVTDGVKLYAADQVQGRVVSLNPDGSAITFLGARYGGGFDIEHLNTIAQSGEMLFLADSGEGGNCNCSPVPPQVVSINKAGGPFTTLFSGPPLVDLTGIAAGNGAIFVADAGANIIWTVPYAGGTPSALVAGAPFVRMRRLIFFNNALYVTDASGIYRVDLDDCPTQFAQAQQQLALLQGQVTSLNAQLQNLNGSLAEGLTALGQDFQAAFKDGQFQMPGSTPLAQFQNLVNAIRNLKQGQALGLFINLGGSPGERH